MIIATQLAMAAALRAPANLPEKRKESSDTFIQEPYKKELFSNEGDLFVYVSGPGDHEPDPDELKKKKKDEHENPGSERPGKEAPDKPGREGPEKGEPGGKAGHSK